MLDYVLLGIESEIKRIRGARAFLLASDEIKVCGVADSLQSALDDLDVAQEALSDAANSVAVAIAGLISFGKDEQ